MTKSQAVIRLLIEDRAVVDGVTVTNLQRCNEALKVLNVSKSGRKAVLTLMGFDYLIKGDR